MIGNEKGEDLECFRYIEDIQYRICYRKILKEVRKSLIGCLEEKFMLIEFEIVCVNFMMKILVCCCFSEDFEKRSC